VIALHVDPRPGPQFFFLAEIFCRPELFFLPPKVRRGRVTVNKIFFSQPYKKACQFAYKCLNVSMTWLYCCSCCVPHFPGLRVGLSFVFLTAPICCSQPNSDFEGHGCKVEDSQPYMMKATKILCFAISFLPCLI